MAMSKQIDLPSGVTVNYHRVERFSVARAPEGFIAEGVVGLYLDADKAASGAAPVESCGFRLKMPADQEPTREAIYRILSAPVRYMSEGYTELEFVKEDILWDEDVLFPDDVRLSSNEKNEDGTWKYPDGVLYAKKGDVHIAKGSVRFPAGADAMIPKTRTVPDPESVSHFNDATAV